MAYNEECDVVSCSDSDSDDSTNTDELSSSSDYYSGSTKPSNPLSQKEPCPQKRRKRTKRASKTMVWVGNLPPNSTSKGLVEHFKPYKPHILNKPSIMAPKKAPDAPYRFSFIRFGSLHKAEEAVEYMNGTMFQGRKLSVRLKGRGKKCLENKTKPVDKQSSKAVSMQNSHKKGNPSVSSLFVVQVKNFPRGLDEEYLKGLVAGHQFVSCDVFDQKVTLRFSSPEDARKAAGALNKVSVHGTRLCADLVIQEVCKDGKTQTHGDLTYIRDESPATPYPSLSKQTCGQVHATFSPHPKQTPMDHPSSGAFLLNISDSKDGIPYSSQALTRLKYHPNANTSQTFLYQTSDHESPHPTTFGTGQCTKLKEIVDEPHGEKKRRNSQPNALSKQKPEPKIEEILQCSEEQRAYLCRILDKDGPARIMKRLQTKLFVSKGEIVIIGTKREVAEAERELLKLVPKSTLHVFEVETTQYIKPLLEEHILMALDHVILTEENGKGKCDKLKVFLFEDDHLRMTQAREKLKNSLSPGVTFFHVNPKSKSILMKVLSSLEKKYRCRVDLMSLDSSRVTVHGLTVEEREKIKVAIKQYIEENYIIVRELPFPSISSIQMKFILLHHGEKLKKQGKSLQSCELPFFLIRKSALELSSKQKMCFKVVGSAKAITAFDDFLKVFKKSSFTEERFSLHVSHLNRYLWQKRWEALKHKAEDSQTAALEFKLPTNDSSSPVHFIVYGDQVDNVLRIKQTVESEALAGEAKKVLKLTPEQFRLVQTAYTDKQLNIDNCLVVVKFVEKDHVIFINSLAVTADAINIVEAKITGFVKCNSIISEDILFSDSLLYSVFTDSNKFSFCGRALSIAKREKVSLVFFKKSIRMGVCLRGNTSSVEAVKAQISSIVEDAKAIMGKSEVTTDPKFLPVLTHDNKARQVLQSMLLNSFFVTTQGTPRIFLTMKETPRTVQETKVIKSMHFQPLSAAQRVKLSLCQGWPTVQSSDVIVIPTDEYLQNTKSLGKVILKEAGSSILQESTRYVQKHGKLKPSTAVCFNSGRLSCKRIAYVALSRLEEKAILYSAIYNSMCAAEGYNSLSLPAIGFEEFDFAADVFAEMSLKAVRDFSNIFPQSSIKDVSIVFSKKESHKPFLDILPKIFPQDILQLDVDEELDLSSSSPSDMTWLWKTDHGGYSQYGAEESKRLTTLYHQNPHRTCSLTINGTVYNIDMVQMVQENIETGYRREIKVLCKPSSPEFQWFWTDNNGMFLPYSSGDSAALETMFKSGKPKPRLIEGKLYNFDLERMVQINWTTRNERPIQRKPAELSPVAIDAPSKSMSVTLYGVKTNLTSASNFTIGWLESNVQVEQIELPPKLEHGIEKKVKEVASKYKVSCEIICAQSKNVVVIQGLKTDCAYAVKDLENYLTKQQKMGEGVNPPEWEPQSSITQLFSVHRGSLEWTRVEQRFNRTMPSYMYPIKKIQRIQNIFLWEKWVEERNRMEKFKGCVNEKELFHGTQQNDPKQIYDSEIGFDMRFCSSGMWGVANYFAVNASYSHAYSHKNDLGQREMFLVKVITGDSYLSPPDHSLRMPPLKKNTGQSNLLVRYDTVNGMTNGSQVFMTYDNQKAYPAYLIHYTSLDMMLR